MTVGLPYWLFRVLPEVFPDKLPNRPGQGYARLGFIYETPSSDLPIGTTRSNDWVPLVGLNCATCHSGTYRDAPGATPKIVLGMPAHAMDLQGYARFLSACAKDPRFNADTLVAAMKKHPEFGFFDGLVYSWFAVGRSKDGILERDRHNAWFDKRPPQGPGRVDTFNPYKAMFPKETGFETDVTVGTVDLPSLWNQRIRTGLWLHWDGNNNSVDERNKSAAIGAGATPDSLDLAALDRIAKWILDLKPPSFPAGADRCEAGELGPRRLRAAVRKLPRHGPAADRPGDRHRRDRHRHRAAAIVHAGARQTDEHHRRGPAVAVLAFPQDERLRGHAARRHLASRALPSQRIGAHA